MSSKKLTTSQYPRQELVRVIRDAVVFCNEQRSTHISRHYMFLATINNIGYEVHRYIFTGVLPFEEFYEERLWTDEEEWNALIYRNKRLSLGRRGKKDKEIGGCI